MKTLALVRLDWPNNFFFTWTPKKMQYSTSDRQLYFRCWSSEIATPYSVHFRLDLSYHRRQSVHCTVHKCIIVVVVVPVGQQFESLIFWSRKPLVLEHAHHGRAATLAGRAAHPALQQNRLSVHSVLYALWFSDTMHFGSPHTLYSRHVGSPYTLYSRHIGSPYTLYSRHVGSPYTLYSRHFGSPTLGTLVLRTLCTLGTLVLRTLCTLGTLDDHFVLLMDPSENLIYLCNWSWCTNGN